MSWIVSHALRDVPRRVTAPADNAMDVSITRIVGLCNVLVSPKGETAAAEIAGMILASYDGLPDHQRIEFLSHLARCYGPDQDALDKSIRAFQMVADGRTVAELHKASEPRRQQLIRMLNLAPGGTGLLLRMRRDVLRARTSIPDFEVLDADFRHVLTSWFNGGFLILRRIEWSSPGAILAKIIAYEAVHEIRSWEELKRRVAPPDRRCYAFFHPRLPDEPLIFVEVALTDIVPTSIDVLLSADRVALPSTAATTAVFYSISNCQDGLRGIPFGGFLIKQVVELLKRELPSLETFVTLSPMPGFAHWLERQCALMDKGLINASEREALCGLNEDASGLMMASDALKSVLSTAAARYLLHARTAGGDLADPVARFHIGNGARLEQLNWLADKSEKGLRDYHGILVNYLYDIRQIEKHHRMLNERDEVPASTSVRKLAREAAKRRTLLSFSWSAMAPKGSHQPGAAA